MPKQHIVQQGDTTISLSEQFGLFALTIWNDPANASLREQRGDMNVLLPGDVLTIPDLRQKIEDCNTNARHVFRRKGIPALLRMQIFDYEEPRVNQAYTLTIDGKEITGTTNAKGILEEYVPAQATSGELIIGEDKYRMLLDFGHLDPLTEVSGVQKRLNNMGYDCGEPNGELNDRTRQALAELQSRFDLPITGEINDATRKKIGEMHDAAYDFPKPQKEPAQ
jgi:hypothetical protein